MYRTEEQARKRWCPFVRLSDEGPANRWPNDGFAIPDNRCIASRCMAWRFEPFPYVDRKVWNCPDLHAASEPKRPDHVDPLAQFIPDRFGSDWGARWVESDESLEARRADALRNLKGYCGLAGRPE